MSAGVGAPTMQAIHSYLRAQLSALPANDAIGVLRGLLKVLESQPESPRSVQVRLYHILQTSADPDIRGLWSRFGLALLAGTVAGAGLNGESSPRPLWSLEPSAAHKWAAGLAVQGRAIVMSLNYDGLTRKAVEHVATRFMDPAPPERQTARILSTAEEIRGFFTGDEADGESPGSQSANGSGKIRWAPVPIVKFRGDVFHAICSNGRCPSHRQPTPLYDLLWPPTPAREAERDPASILLCPSCGNCRQLAISFPGVHVKEQEIDEALAAIHEFHGTRFSRIVYLGFSGTWDEALVEYLTERARALDAPVVSMSKDPTPAIHDVCLRIGVEYRYVQYASRDAELDSELEEIVESDGAPTWVGRRAVSQQPSVEFVEEAFSVFPPPATKFHLRLPGEAGQREFTVSAQSHRDTFGGIAGAALSTRALLRLQRCGQLGLKTDFVHGTDPTRHTRFHHSAAATMIAMVWYEALLPQRGHGNDWAWTQEARLALELAVLYHDARHLPFSHMMEEVLRELNWAQVPELTWADVGSPSFASGLQEALARSECVADPIEWWSAVDALQRGTSGVPWLEAIVDSALDADKIEYLFHDSTVTHQNVRLTDLRTWFETFLSGQSLTPEGLIRLEGQSCIAALDLLQERMYLYRRLYLAPELRVLECMARYIVLTWLKWRLPDVVALPSEPYDLERSLRAAKSDAAARLLWQLYDRGDAAPEGELAGLAEMVEELSKLSHLDPAAVQWVQTLWSRLAGFKRVHGSPTIQDARDTYTKMSPIGPIYVHESAELEIRAIARRWRVNYPLVALIDIARFPSFLATPRSRTMPSGIGRATAEQFLVPSARPSEWHGGARATVPLHRCDFGAFEHPVLQVIVFDPLGETSGGSAFLHQIMLKELQRKGIRHAESPEQVRS